MLACMFTYVYRCQVTHVYSKGRKHLEWLHFNPSSASLERHLGASSGTARGLGSQRAEGGLLGTLGITGCGSINGGVGFLGCGGDAGGTTCGTTCCNGVTDGSVGGTCGTASCPKDTFGGVGGVMGDWMMGGARGTAGTTAGWVACMDMESEVGGCAGCAGCTGCGCAGGCAAGNGNPRPISAAPQAPERLKPALGT